jgi:hypothetical protein
MRPGPLGTERSVETLEKQGENSEEMPFEGSKCNNILLQ